MTSLYFHIWSRDSARTFSWTSRKMNFRPVYEEVLYPGGFLVEDFFDRENPTKQLSKSIKLIYNIDK